MRTRKTRTIARLGGFVALAMCMSVSLIATASADTNLRWVNAAHGRVPRGAIIGGREPGRILYVCRGWYSGGVHPGKIVGNNCNIGWGGTEVLLNRYQVLVGNNRSVGWLHASSGEVPAGAIPGGYESGRSELYVCRVEHHGLQPGKLVGENCNIGYAGRELLFSSYQVLVPE